MPIRFEACPTCGAKPDEPCRTTQGRRRKAAHDDRPFHVHTSPQEAVDIDNMMKGLEDAAAQLGINIPDNLRWKGIKRNG